MKKSFIVLLFTGLLALSSIPFSGSVSQADNHNAFNYIHNVTTTQNTTLYANDGKNNFTQVKTRSLGAHTDWFTDTWVSANEGDPNTYLRVSTNEYVRMEDVFASLKLAQSGDPHITTATVTANPAAIVYDNYGMPTTGRLADGTNWRIDEQGYPNTDSTHVYFRVGNNQWVSGADVTTY